MFSLVGICGCVYIALAPVYQRARFFFGTGGAAAPTEKMH